MGDLMDWIKVLNRHILLEYNDLRDSEFTAWIKIMALTASLEHEPNREQMLKYVHHATLQSLDDKLMKHSCTLHEVLMKVLCDVHDVSMKREQWKQKKKQQRAVMKTVPGDVPIDVSGEIREEKIREDNIREEEKTINKQGIIYENEKFKTIPEKFLEKWKQVAPGINIQTEIKKAELWLISNPDKKRSKWSSFLSNWMVRAQENYIKYGGKNVGIRTSRSDLGDKTLQSRTDAEVSAALTRYEEESSRRKTGGIAGHNDAPDFPGLGS
jgi:hypothetical protein